MRELVGLFIVYILVFDIHLIYFVYLLSPRHAFLVIVLTSVSSK